MGVCPTTADADRAPRRSAAYKPVLDDTTYRSFDSLATASQRSLSYDTDARPPSTPSPTAAPPVKKIRPCCWPCVRSYCSRPPWTPSTSVAIMNNHADMGSSVRQRRGLSPGPHTGAQPGQDQD